MNPLIDHVEVAALEALDPPEPTEPNGAGEAPSTTAGEPVDGRGATTGRSVSVRAHDGS